jgi:cytochrome c-type biogenesis protein CcmH
MLLTLVLAAVLALVAVGAVLLPLLSSSQGPIRRGLFNREVYQHQLEELEREVAGGSIAPEDAATARLEIHRRLLSIADGREVPALPVRPPTSGPALAIGGFLACFAAAGYGWLGSPTLPDRPFIHLTPGEEVAATPHQDGGDMGSLALQLRAKLDSNPDDLDGWLLYARTESRLGEWGKAAEGYGNAIALGGKTVDSEGGYGEMLVLAAQGVVTPPALSAFHEALKLDPKDQASRYYLALADAQAGRSREAVKGWLALAADVPVDSPTRAEIARKVDETARNGGFTPPALPKGAAPSTAAQVQDQENEPDSAAPGPTSDQVAAAAAMSDADRNEMISGMIDRLAGALAANPTDLDGWTRLARAYAVRNEFAKSIDAFDHAIALKPEDPQIPTEAASTLLSHLPPGDATPDRVAVWLKELARLSPDSPDLLWLEGMVAARQGDPEQARALWNRLLGKLPKNDVSYNTVTSALAELPGGGAQ